VHPLVVHCKRDAYDVYIGRGSVWGNDFSHLPNTKARFHVVDRSTAIACYRQQLWRRLEAGDVSLEELAALQGKRLGCWCAPKPCHGEVLVAASGWAAAEIRRRERSR